MEIQVKRSRRIAAVLMVGLAMTAGATSASAQKLGRTYYEDSENGYRFRTPDGWSSVPPQSTERDMLDDQLVNALRSNTEQFNQFRAAHRSFKRVEHSFRGRASEDFSISLAAQAPFRVRDH